MNKAVLLICTVFSSLSFAKSLTCHAIQNSTFAESVVGKVEIVFNNRQVETIDYIETSSEDSMEAPKAPQRIFSRTYSDPTNRGGYAISYCNPDTNEISEYTGISIYSHCKVQKSSDDVFFDFRLDKSLTKGEFSITFLGKEIEEKKVILDSCK
ncbi:hypothetical protein D3C87_1382980 [compost metagenome]